MIIRAGDYWILEVDRAVNLWRYTNKEKEMFGHHTRLWIGFVVLALILSISPATGLVMAAPAQTKRIQSDVVHALQQGEGLNNLGQSMRPLEKLLNADGTLNLKSGFNGSVDPAGWTMVTGANGQPRFVPADSGGRTRAGTAYGQSSPFGRPLLVPGDEYWDGGFALPGPGVNGNVRAIAVNGSDVYVGGAFTTAGGASANRIARWSLSSSKWFPLGTGVGGNVNAIAVKGNYIYVGGTFTEAGGGINFNGIAKWNLNSSQWERVGTGGNYGVNRNVTAIAVRSNDSNIYVVGDFTTAGGQPANRIAIWNGSTWTSLGTGVNSNVNAIALSGNDVYVSGGFTTAGGGVANRIAKWNGTNWSSLGTGMSNGNVNAIEVSGNVVYVGGAFTMAGGGIANRIAKWNGSWLSLGTGVNGPVNAIEASGSDIYVGGSFTATASGVSASRIAKWNSNSSLWSPLGSGVNGNVLAIKRGDFYNDSLYVGGSFTTAGGKPSSMFGIWHSP